MMNLKTVLSSLNGSYNSFTPNRSMSVSGALVENLKFNLRFRFSLLGMITSLTRSSSLYNLAQQRYADQNDKRASQEEVSFKTSVASSVAALGRQVSLLESIAEKNSAMINMIVNDLGYFKGQRKFNFMTSTNLGRNTSFKAPVNSKTVKGQLEIINEQIQELKKKGVGTGKGEDGGIESRLLGDMGKIAIAGGVGAYLAGALVEQLGVDGKGGSAKQIAQTIGGLLGVAATPSTAKVIEFVLSKTLPIVSQVGRIYLGAKYVAPFALDKIGNSIERTKNRLTGTASETELPNPYPPGSIEYLVEEEKRTLKRQALQVFDTLLLPATVLLTAKYGSKAAKFVGGTKIFKTISKKTATAYRARFPTPIQQARISQGSFDERAESTRAFKESKAYTLFDRPIPQRAARAASSATRRANRGIITRGARTVRGGAAYVAGLGVKSKGSERLGKLAEAIKRNETLRKIPIANLGYLIFEVGMMANAQEDYDKNIIDYVEYKDRMTGSLTRLVNVVGVSALGALIGGIIGTAAFPIPFAGTAAGALIGAGASIVASFAFSGINGDSAIAEKLFGIMFENETLEAQVASGVYQSPARETQKFADASAAATAQSGNENAVKSVRNNNPGNLRFANQREAIGKDSSGFAIFPTPEAGLRAMEAQIKLDTQTRGQSLTQFISKYAPSNENDTQQYINFVSKETGIQPYEQVPLSKIPELMSAMIMIEGGPSAVNYYASASRGSIGTMIGGGGTAVASMIPNQTADQAMLKYFISLGAGSTAQMMPSAENKSTSQAAATSTTAESKADAALVAVQGTLQEVTRLAQEIKVLQQKNDLDASFPQVRPA
jgi:hypothetical protein